VRLVRPTPERQSPSPTPTPGAGVSSFSLAAIGSALPDLGLAAVFIGTWIAPRVFGDEMARWLFLVMLMELIVIQAAGLMGLVAITHANRAVRGTAIITFGAFYTLFAGGISIAMASWWPVVGFWCQTLNRLLGVILGQVPDDETKAFVLRGWAAGITFYLAGVFLVLLLPIPPLGLTPSYVAVHESTGGAWWSGQPQKLMAFGVFYYGLTAWSELAAHEWPFRRAKRDSHVKRPRVRRG
jgi:hypothetical protein